MTVRVIEPSVRGAVVICCTLLAVVLTAGCGSSDEETIRKAVMQLGADAKSPKDAGAQHTEARGAAVRRILSQFSPEKALGVLDTILASEDPSRRADAIIALRLLPLHNESASAATRARAIALARRAVMDRDERVSNRAITVLGELAAGDPEDISVVVERLHKAESISTLLACYVVLQRWGASDVILEQALVHAPDVHYRAQWELWRLRTKWAVWACRIREWQGLQCPETLAARLISLMPVDPDLALAAVGTLVELKARHLVPRLATAYETLAPGISRSVLGAGILALDPEQKDTALDLQNLQKVLVRAFSGEDSDPLGSVALAMFTAWVTRGAVASANSSLVANLLVGDQSLPAEEQGELLVTILREARGDEAFIWSVLGQTPDAVLDRILRSCPEVRHYVRESLLSKPRMIMLSDTHPELVDIAMHVRAIADSCEDQ